MLIELICYIIFFIIGYYALKCIIGIGEWHTDQLKRR
jgi:hypothetical protein